MLFSSSSSFSRLFTAPARAVRSVMHVSPCLIGPLIGACNPAPWPMNVGRHSRRLPLLSGGEPPGQASISRLSRGRRQILRRPYRNPAAAAAGAGPNNEHPVVAAKGRVTGRATASQLQYDNNGFDYYSDLNRFLGFSALFPAVWQSGARGRVMSIGALQSNAVYMLCTCCVHAVYMLHPIWGSRHPVTSPCRSTRRPNRTGTATSTLLLDHFPTQFQAL